jgi:hypothetical protein
MMEDFGRDDGGLGTKSWLQEMYRATANLWLKGSNSLLLVAVDLEVAIEAGDLKDSAHIGRRVENLYVNCTVRL